MEKILSEAPEKDPKRSGRLARNCSKNWERFPMKSKPARPRPSEKITDYDDGDPYSCIAAGVQEEKLQRDLQARVEQCFGASGNLEFLIHLDQTSVKTALYDIWNQQREPGGNRALADWAAQQMAALGDSSLVEYDR